MPIGAPIIAEDDDGEAVSYTKGGADEDSFDISSTTGQLTTKAGIDLDYETKKIYTVIVTANDSTEQPNDTASIRVTIKVIDEDEKPDIWDTANTARTTEHSVLSFKENSNDAVIDLDARDPEGVTPIVWSKFADTAEGDQDLDGDGNDDVGSDDVADNRLFSISSDGELNFKTPPNFEYPQDEGMNNEYHVVVQASDRGNMSVHNWFKVTVTVVNVDETGEVTWTVDPDGALPDGGTEMPLGLLLQFQPGATLTASVTDADDDTNGATWKWYRGPSDRGPWVVISDAEGDAYTLVDTPDTNEDIDVGKYLRAEASYGGKTADFVAPNPVQRAKEAANTAPKFPATTNVMRNVAEHTPAGVNIGAAIEADDIDGDILTYSLVGTADDNEKFHIDPATGRLMVKEDLDFEHPTDTGGTGGDNAYVVTIRATDSSGDDGVDATVMIIVTDVNEPPTVNGEGMANDHAEDADVALMTGDTPGAWMATANDPEGGNIAWTLSGADKDLFKFTGSGNDSGSMRGLLFKAKPDFEDPGDANTDNIYEVTVVATDGSGNSAEQSVTVKVTDLDETGKVELSTQNPVVGVEITATPIDSDTYVNNVTWVWHRLDMRVAAGDDLPAAPEPDNPDMLGPILGAKSNMYTPVAADVGRHLVAVVSYLDRTYDEDNDAADNTPDNNFVGFENEVRSEVTTKVLASPTNQAPKFLEGSSAVRLVAENTVPGEDAGNIGDTVVAMDPDGADLSYELGGEDAASFELTPLMGNQLRVRAGTMLNYETKDTYTVVVMAKDGSGQANDTASITVTIMVVDVDEEPAITEAGLMVSGPQGHQLQRERYGRRGDLQCARTGCGRDHLDCVGCRRWLLQHQQERRRAGLQEPARLRDVQGPRH